MGSPTTPALYYPPLGSLINLNWASLALNNLNQGGNLGG